MYCTIEFHPMSLALGLKLIHFLLSGLLVLLCIDENSQFYLTNKCHHRTSYLPHPQLLQ